jgi:hypothetical protein
MVGMITHSDSRVCPQAIKELTSEIPQLFNSSPPYPFTSLLLSTRIKKSLMIRAVNPQTSLP